MDSGKTRGWTGQIDWPPVPSTERGKHRKTTSFASWTPMPRDSAARRRDEPDPFEDTDQLGRTVPSWDTDPFWDTEPFGERAVPCAVAVPHEPVEDDRPTAFEDTMSFDDLVLDDTGVLDDPGVLDATAGLAPRPRYLLSHEDDAPRAVDTVPFAEPAGHTAGDDGRSRRSGAWLLAGSSVAALCGLLAAPMTLFNQSEPEMPLPGMPHEHAEARPPAPPPPSMPELGEPSPRSLPHVAEPAGEPASTPPAGHLVPPEPEPRPPRPPEAHEPPLLTEVGNVTARSLRLLSGALAPEEGDPRDADDSAPLLLDFVRPLTSAEEPAR